VSMPDPVARSLDDIVRTPGVMATFHGSLSGQSHRWKLRSATRTVLAQTVRVHRGGKFAQTCWRLWNRTTTSGAGSIRLHATVRL